MTHKKFLTAFTLVSIAFSSAKAQDLIVTNDGETITAYNLDMSVNVIYYTLTPDADSPMSKIQKADVLIIRKQDGTKLDPSATPAAAPVALSVRTPSDINDAAVIDDSELISECNSRADNLVEFLTNPKKPGNTAPCRYLAVFKVPEDSHLSNGILSVDYQFGWGFFDKSGSVNFMEYDHFNNNYGYPPFFRVVLKNLTDKYIYIDQAQCCITINGKSQFMYDPKIASKSVSQTDVSSVGVGFGILGAASADASTVVTTSQRVISLPPQTHVELTGVLMSPLIGPDKELMNVSFPTLTEHDVVGSVHSFSNDSSPIGVDVTIGFCDNQKMEGSKSFTTRLYLDKFIGYSTNQGLLLTNQLGAYGMSHKDDIPINTGSFVVIFDR